MLSIILPSYNGYTYLQKSVPKLISYLEKHQVSFEIILIDDGSIDTAYTRDLAIQFNCVLLENGVNLGKGASVKKGINHAKGDVVLFTDIDLPFGVEIILNTYKLMLNDKTIDLVIGDRTDKSSDYFEKIPLTRNLVSKVFSGVISYLILNERIDTQCGFKAFKKDAAKALFKKVTVKRFAFDVEIIAIARSHNLFIKKVPVHFNSSQEGASAGLILQGIRMVRDLIKIRWKRWFGYYNA